MSTVGSQALGTKIQVDANIDLHKSVKEELDCELLQKPDPCNWMSPDITHLRVLRELADVTVRLLSIVQEVMEIKGYPRRLEEDQCYPHLQELKGGSRKLQVHWSYFLVKLQNKSSWGLSQVKLSTQLGKASVDSPQANSP